MFAAKILFYIMFTLNRRGLSVLILVEWRSCGGSGAQCFRQGRRGATSWVRKDVTRSIFGIRLSSKSVLSSRSARRACSFTSSAESEKKSGTGMMLSFTLAFVLNACSPCTLQFSLGKAVSPRICMVAKGNAGAASEGGHLKTKSR